jgi:putrescine transport system substrate-binding protein
MLRSTWLAAALCVAGLVQGCDAGDPGARRAAAGDSSAGKQVVNLYIWADFLGPDTLEVFEQQTGIKVRVSYFETDEVLESRLLTGNSGFDVVDPTAPFFQRQIRSGAYLPLDRAKLPNLVNLDPAIMERVAENDPGNQYGVVYMWGTDGIGYNQALVARALPNVPINSWRLVLDPVYAARLAGCGINVFDSPTEMARLVLRYLGRDPNSPSPQDLAEVERVLMRIRPFVRTIDSAGYIQAMANGDICVSVGYSGDFVQARKRALEAANGNRIAYVIPDEGSLIYFNMLAIPRDAPNAANAHAFINYLLSPPVIAKISNAIGYANANAAATPLVDASLVKDAAIYPTTEERARLFVQRDASPELSREIIRIWQRFKTGQ